MSWWKFWSPESGAIGGFIAGVVYFAVALTAIILVHSWVHRL